MGIYFLIWVETQIKNAVRYRIYEKKNKIPIIIYEFSSQQISVWRITNIHNRKVHHPESGPIAKAEANEQSNVWCEQKYNKFLPFGKFHSARW